MPIGLFDTETPLLALREQIVERLAAVVERGVYILGPEVKAFEQEFADYLGVRHAIGVAQRHRRDHDRAEGARRWP